ncbi:MAG: LemA family protein [Burkholderiales bacterium]
MPVALTLAIACALLLCWAVGAYNRLVRLRSRARQAFAQLLVQLRRRQALAERVAGQLTVEPAAAVAAAAGVAPGGLIAAARQFGAALSAAHERPLEVDALRSLGAADAVLTLAWDRHVSDSAQNAVDEEQATQWHAVAAGQAHANAQFEETAALYNASIAQFPASIIAALFGLRRAGALQP